ncbi:MAG: hypothetical protein U0271_41575 [Polyangiaceae bacterium]
MQHRIVASFLVFALAACSDSHTDLGQDTSSSSSTGAGGQGGFGGTGAGGMGGAPPVEPDGPTALTLVNGVVDRPAIRVCLMDNPPSPLDDALPLPPAQLAFAHSAPVDTASLPSTSDVEIAVLAGDLGAVAGQKCRAIVDGPPIDGVDVISLGVAPTSVFAAPRSLFLGVSGCIGAAPASPTEAEQYCGPGAVPLAPFPLVSIGSFSRLANADFPGIQVVNLSSGAKLDTYLKGPLDGAPDQLLASKVAIGQALPFPPYWLDVAALASVGGSTFRAVLSTPGGGFKELLLVDAMTQGGLTVDDFGPADNVALVAVGASPAIPTPAASMNAFTVVGVRVSGAD